MRINNRAISLASMLLATVSCYTLANPLPPSPTELEKIQYDLGRLSSNERNFHDRMNYLESHTADINRNNIKKISHITKNLTTTQANNKKDIENQLKNSNKMAELKLEDAANRSQSYTNLSVDNLRLQSFDKMDKLSDQVYGEIININDQLDEKIVQLDNRYEQQVTQLKHKINKTAKQANSGIASVAAMSNIPYSLNSRFSAGLGIGHYKNGKALAAGAQYQVRKNINLRSSIAWNNANSPVIGAGIAVGW
ncbi:YadA C-terminal domain-containing protein [Providencia sp. R33]|uniref:YadA C-terminal domain-containing protein n=1 Tax=Providencia sp. R33 TaxID=2828763 RepID=UPI002104167C|nr:YadA C-terminal domain-containing protein [Providencia sp. R33]